MKKRVLFVMEKWCDATPKLAFTNSFQNFINTFSQSQPNCHVNIIHIDECRLVYNRPIDDILLEYCQHYKTDIIFFSFLGGQPEYNPSIECCQKLKDMGIYLCFLWHDTNPVDIQSRSQVYDVSHLNITYDNATSALHNAMKKRDKEIVLFAPQDEYLFYPDKQYIPISFIGSLRDPYRRGFLQAAKERIPHLFVTGGQRESALTPEEYAAFIRASKININYSYHPFGYYQIKGRVFEILASKSLLLESKNDSTRKLLRPGIDYVEYDSLDDLTEKATYYSVNEDKRLEIATNGHETYLKNFTGKHFWDKIIDRIMEETKGQ